MSDPVARSVGPQANGEDPGIRGRVLCVTSNFPRWAGDSTTPFVLTLARDLQAQGWQVDVLAPHAPGAALRETLDGVRVERFRYFWPASRQTVCYQGGAMVNLRKRPWEKLKLPLLVVAETLAVTRRLLSRRYDLLHSHWILPQGFTGMIASRMARVPHVITVHGGDIFSLRGGLMTRLKRLALQSAQAVTVNSSFTAAATSAVSSKIRDLPTIPMGVDVRPLDARETALAAQLRGKYRKNQGPLLIFVGRLVEEKGAEDALRAVGILKGNNPDVRLLIVGEGPDRPELERLAGDLGIVERVSFPGWVDRADIRAYMAAADIFLGPSRTARNGWVEAQGLTFLEAMSAGTPVIGTHLGGIVDSIIHEQTGLLVDERSPDQLASAVARLSLDTTLAVRIAESAGQHVRARFSRETSAAAFAQLFNELTTNLRGTD